VWSSKEKEGRTEENYLTDKGRKKLREGTEPNKFMRRGTEGRKFKGVGKKGRKLRQWERQEEDRRERELVGKKNRTDSAKERMLRE
jgi:hypothetical protein